MSYVVGGSSTYSKAADRFPPNAPARARGARGPYILPEGGGAPLIDVVASLGAVALGHGLVQPDPGPGGPCLSLPSPYEEQAAERLVRLLGPARADWRVRWAKNGTDAVSAAVRIARAVTGRRGVAVYEGSYHGFQDWSMQEPPKNGGVYPMHTSRFPMFDLDLLEARLSLRAVAALVVEPVVSSAPRLPPEGYWAEVRAMCDTYGTLLVLDELVTGLRLGLPGALTAWGIDADLACYGKAIANGWPLAVLTGRPELMGRIEKDVFMSCTYAGDAYSLAACDATLRIAEEVKLPERLGQMGEHLGAWLRMAADEHGAEVGLAGYPARWVLQWPDPSDGPVFWAAAVEARVLGHGYLNLMHAHQGVFAQLGASLDEAMFHTAQHQARRRPAPTAAV